VVDEFAEIVKKNLAKDLPEGQLKSWEYLVFHKTYVEYFANCVITAIEEGAEAAEKKINEFISYIMANEMNIHKTLDVMQVRGVVKNSVK